MRIVPDEYRIDGLAAAKGETWKNMRQILSPAFSASKMKMVNHACTVVILDLIIVLMSDQNLTGCTIN